MYLNGYSPGVVDSDQQRRLIQGLKVFVGRLAGPLKRSVVIEDQHPISGQSRIKLLQFMPCRAIPVGIQAKAIDLIFAARRIVKVPF